MKEEESVKSALTDLQNQIEEMSAGCLPAARDDSDTVTLLSRFSERLSLIRSRELIIGEIISRINEGTEFNEIMNFVYDNFHEIIPYSRIGVSLLSDDGSLRSVWVKSESSIKLTLDHQAVLKGSSLEKIIHSGRPRIINDLEEYLQRRPRSESTRIILEEGIRSSLTCPLIAAGRPVGFIFFSSTEKNTYIYAHAGLYERIAGHLSVAIERSRLYDSMKELTRKTENQNIFIKKIFGRYVSDEVMEEVLRNPEGLQLGGDRRKITLLMSDLRGFSSVVESIPPEHSIQMLNNYFGKMVDVIDLFGGTINEIIGDAILVIFGAPRSSEEDCLRAVACAAAMQQAMESVNAENTGQGLPPLRMGIALHTGEAVVGNIGSEKRARYGVVGSLVNLTGRFESVTAGGQVLISEAVRDECAEHIETDKCIVVYAKGFAEPFSTYELSSVTKDGITLEVPSDFEELTEILNPVPVYFRIYSGKTLELKPWPGRILMLSSDAAVLEILPETDPLTGKAGDTQGLSDRLRPGESLQIESVSYSAIQKEKREKRVKADMILTERPDESERYLPPLDSKITEINDGLITVQFTYLSPEAMQSLEVLLSRGNGIH